MDALEQPFDLIIQIGETVDCVLLSDTEALQYARRQYYAQIFDFLLQHERDIRGMLARFCMKNTDTSIDELWSEVVIDFAPRAFDTFDPAKGTLKRHVLHTIKWYLLKWRKRRKRRRQREPLIEDYLQIKGEEHAKKERHVYDGSMNIATLLQDRLEGEEDLSVEQREMVHTILGRLSEYDRTLVQLHYVLGWSYDKIAAALECSEFKARNHCDKAIYEAKKIADRLQR